MPTVTKIEWADLTINPTRGCSHCSPGCDNCYAERFAARLALNPKSGKSYAGLVDFKGKWTGRISDYDLSVFDRLPNAPKRIFVGSMTDLFFSGVNDTPRQAVTTVDGTTYEFAPDILHARLAMILIEIGKHPQHTFMFLTKRPAAMREVMLLMLNRPLPNLWLGVTVCNQAEADAKIPALLATPAAKRFVSIEPMLGPVDLTSIDYLEGQIEGADESGMLDALRGLTMDDAPTHPALDWVICGGETGPGARPMHPDWVRGLRDQCKAAEVPFFFKSWGEWTPSFYQQDGGYRVGGDVQIAHGAWRKRHTFHESPEIRMYCVGKKRAGRLLDGQEHNEIPMPQVTMCCPICGAHGHIGDCEGD